jgi:hypothetical protein
MLQAIKQNLISNIKNIPGWRTNRKIVLIECDDWGSIRMPSKKVYDNLYRRGVKVSSGWFNMYDTLETQNDLEQLFDVLYSVKDKDNKPAVMTAVTNVANPDLDKIRSDGFIKYYYEPFTATLKRYHPNFEVFKLWNEGITDGIFMPELHGREHLPVQIWMEKLKEGDKTLLVAFNHGFASMDIPGISLPASAKFMAEFYFTSEDQKPFLVNSIKEGVSLFKEVFGFRPRVFVPGNGVFHPEFDKVAAESGIKFLNVSYSSPFPIIGGKLKYRHFITGQKGPGGITYYIRNCAFEPANPGYKGVEPTIMQIAAAFRWGKPADISTHRVNFVGSIDQANRKNGITELKKLLKTIVQKWPDVEFMNSGDALEYMLSGN